MIQFHSACHRSAMVFLSACVSVSAQTVGFAPEVDSHLKINSFLRTYVDVKDDRDAGETEQFMIGPSIQFYLKPLLKLNYSIRFR